MLVGAFDPSFAQVFAAILALASVALAVVWGVPKLQARRWRRAGITGSALAELENGARGTLVQLVGGVALILTFVATWAQIADTRRVSDETLRLTGLQQENERFTRAMDQLGSKRLEIRVGAITGLGDIAGASRSRREPVVQILLTYLHSRHGASSSDETRAPQAPHLRARPCTEALAPTFGRAAPDAQAALGVIGTHADIAGRRGYNLGGVDLAFVEAPSARFNRANLADSDLGYATLTGADFSNANLTVTNLVYADLNDARFTNARLLAARLELACARRASFRNANAHGAHLHKANLSEADLSGATFASADLPGAVLAGASLRSADLTGADLRDADLRGADLEAANLSGADLTGTNVSRDALSRATTDACTRLPWRRAVSRRCLPAGST